MTRRWILAGFAALLLGGAAPAFASPSGGSLHGVVTGLESGLLLHQVSVTLRSETQPFHQVRFTGRDGAFQFDDVPPGLYSVEAAQPGFRPATLSPILVIPGREVTEHVALERTPVSERPVPVPEPAQTS